MIHTRISTKDGQRLVDPPLEEIARWANNPDANIWVDLEAATQDEIEHIGNTFNLMPLTIEDLTQQGQRAKLESFDNYNVLIMHGMRFNETEETVETPELDLVLGKNFLITNHAGEMPEILRDPRGPDHACQLVGKSTTYALYSVVDRLVDSYYPVMENIDQVIDDLEARVVQDPSTEVLEKIFALRRGFAQLRKVISPQLEVFNRLIAREDEFIDPKYIVYFRDIYDHLVRTFEIIDSYRDLMSSAMDAYLSTISNRQNDIMKRLTLFTTIFMPITFVTGLFGQNFGHMPQVEHDNGYFWWIALAAMGVFSLVQLLYYRRRGWL